MIKDIKYIIEELQKFNPADYSDDKEDIIDNNTIQELTDPVNKFLLFLDKFDWNISYDEAVITNDSNKKTHDEFNLIINELNKLMDSYREVEESEEYAVVRINQLNDTLMQILIIKDDNYIQISLLKRSYYGSDKKDEITILIPATINIFYTNGRSVGLIYARLIDALKDKYKIDPKKNE